MGAEIIKDTTGTAHDPAQERRPRSLRFGYLLPPKIQAAQQRGDPDTKAQIREYTEFIAPLERTPVSSHDVFDTFMQRLSDGDQRIREDYAEWVADTGYSLSLPFKRDLMNMDRIEKVTENWYGLDIGKIRRLHQNLRRLLDQGLVSPEAVSIFCNRGSIRRYHGIINKSLSHTKEALYAYAIDPEHREFSEQETRDYDESIRRFSEQMFNDSREGYLYRDRDDIVEHPVEGRREFLSQGSWHYSAPNRNLEDMIGEDEYGRVYIKLKDPLSTPDTAAQLEKIIRSSDISDSVMYKFSNHPSSRDEAIVVYFPRHALPDSLSDLFSNFITTVSQDALGDTKTSPTGVFISNGLTYAEGAASYHGDILKAMIFALNTSPIVANDPEAILSEENLTAARDYFDQYLRLQGYNPENMSPESTGGHPPRWIDQVEQKVVFGKYG